VKLLFADSEQRERGRAGVGAYVVQREVAGPLPSRIVKEHWKRTTETLRILREHQRQSFFAQTKGRRTTGEKRRPELVSY